ncbi:MAG: IS66 family transposase zinc-finger binding domain-containing protein [FCB group bacterium]|nr:IS66 family transposase zinc-finger binding domain-containing protein [FCB group bacterium]
MITWEKAKEIFDKIQGLAREQAIQTILELVNKENGAELDPSPLTPSGAIPVYKKPNNKKKRRKKARPQEGHPSKSRKVPDHIDEYKEHVLEACPHCGSPVKKPSTTRKRYIEDIPQIEPVVTEHTIRGYWCSTCKKTVEPVVSEAMPNDNIGLRTFFRPDHLAALPRLSRHWRSSGVSSAYFPNSRRWRQRATPRNESVFKRRSPVC